MYATATEQDQDNDISRVDRFIETASRLFYSYREYQIAKDQSVFQVTKL